MTPLPSATKVFDVLDELYIKKAYCPVLEAEAATDDTLKLIYARILGYLILYPINDVARTHVLSEIMSLQQKTSLF
jgi:hypothetical protein